MEEGVNTNDLVTKGGEKADTAAVIVTKVIRKFLIFWFCSYSIYIFLFFVPV